MDELRAAADTRENSLSVIIARRHSDDPNASQRPFRYLKTYIRWQKGWQKPFPPLADDKTLIPRQFACAIAPDPIAFLLPIGQQRATRSA